MVNNKPTPPAARRDKRVRQQQSNNNNGGGENPQPQEESMFDSVLRWIIVFISIQLIAQAFSGLVQHHKEQPQTPEQTMPITDPLAEDLSKANSNGDGIAAVAAVGSSTNGIATKRKPAGASVPTTTTQNKRNLNKHTKKKKPVCIWKKGTVMDLHVYVTDSSIYKDDVNDILAEWHESNLILGSAPPSPLDSLFGSSSSSSSNPKHANPNPELSSSSSSTRNTNLTIPLTDAIRFNETHLYAHVRLIRQEKLDLKNEEEGKDANVFAKTFELTKHRNRKKNRNEKNLLGTTNTTSSSAETTTTTTTLRTMSNPNDKSPLTLASLNTTHDQILLYAKPSLTLQFVNIEIQFPERRSIPQQFGMHMDWYSDYEYYPILYNSEFWMMKENMMEVNGSAVESEVEMIVEHVPIWKWQLMSQMEQSWANQEKMTGEEDTSNDMFRTMLLETNPYLLAVTAIVSVLHTVFDILAFKNDITFFKGKKSMEGLSLRSMVVNAFFQVVILLYLADNETNFMVLMSNGVGLVIEFWKISKAVKVSFEGGKIQWEEASSYKKSKTKEYDEIATSHLLFVTMPLVAGYGLYSLVHQKHKGWYSWILNTLVGFIYMFGFVMMTPQLFINYKLQSVAHLNWRTMTYKSINTFIDDLFAFVIKMPIMHRLACLRDDVIFLVFCYQRYKYRTDYTRVNEFGQCAQPTEEMLMEAEEEKKKQGAMKESRSEGGSSDGNKSSASGVRKRRSAREKRSTS